MLAVIRREAPFLAVGCVIADTITQYAVDVVAISPDTQSNMSPRVQPGDVLLIVKQPADIRRDDVVQYVDVGGVAMSPLWTRMRKWFGSNRTNDHPATHASNADQARSWSFAAAGDLASSVARSSPASLLFSDPHDVLLGRAWAVDGDAVVQNDGQHCRVPSRAMLLGAECWDDEKDASTLLQACQQVAIGERPGLVPQTRVVGRASHILWPPDRVGRLPGPLAADERYRICTSDELLRKQYNTRE